MIIRTQGFFIKRLDNTTHVDENYKPVEKIFRCRTSKAIPPKHKLIEHGELISHK